MIEVLVCPNCGSQFESRGPGTRCPVCNARGERHSRLANNGYAGFSSRPGFRMIAMSGGSGLMLAIVSAIAAPFLISTGIVALALGGIFDVALLVTAGLVLMTLGFVAFAFFLWKLWRGFRGASRAWQDISGASRGDDDRIDGRWQ